MKFNIGSYHDEVFCDIIPMDICHMLMGRLWQFDRHVVHDERENTYTLTKDGVKHKLNPLKEKEGKVCHATRICFVDRKEFLKGMKHENMFFSIISKDNKEVVEEVLVEVADMLGDFFDILSDNVLGGLPPMRKINHQIDLIPGASFPNKESIE